jgi:hypothetical protein
MRTASKRPPRLANGTRVHVRSDHFAEEFDAVVAKGEYDGGWLYRLRVTRGHAPDICRNKEGEVWVYAGEIRPLAQ